QCARAITGVGILSCQPDQGGRVEKGDPRMSATHGECRGSVQDGALAPSPTCNLRQTDCGDIVGPSFLVQAQESVVVGEQVVYRGNALLLTGPLEDLQRPLKTAERRVWVPPF